MLPYLKSSRILQESSVSLVSIFSTYGQGQFTKLFTENISYMSNSEYPGGM